mgnify:CR=1 FL=1
MKTMKTPFILPTAAVLMLAAASLGAERTLQETLKDTAIGAHWIYDDFAKAVTQAKATGRPLLVTFRCVP